MSHRLAPMIAATRAALAFIVVFALVACRSDAGSSPVTGTAIPARSSSGVELVLVPGGSFRRGSERGAPDERPVRTVRVDGFAMDRFEVLQEEYARLELPNPAQFKDPRRPVEQVRWSDAAIFCNRRSEREGLEPVYDEDTFARNVSASGYRLPTEAEWEWAALAGDDRELDFPFAGGVAKLGTHACYAGSSAKRTDPAGTRRANAWGIHDLLGNVAEWCQDVYAEDAYESAAAENPAGPTPPAGGKDPHRVLRGGSWASEAAECRPRRRFHDEPGISDACFARNTYGFRCVRRLSDEERARLAEANASSSGATPAD